MKKIPMPQPAGAMGAVTLSLAPLTDDIEEPSSINR